LLDAIVTVSEAEIAAGVRLAAEESRLVVEPSGALSVAALAVPTARRASRGSTDRSSRSSRAGTSIPEQYRT
jgi:threonine dehydratase